MAGKFCCPHQRLAAREPRVRIGAEIIRRILHGDERGPKRDAVLLNAGAALFVANQARSIGEGWEVAAKVIDDGRAAAKLQELTAR